MITGLHAIIFTKDADALRGFFRDVLGFPSVDAGGGWLIFALPPAELAAHPTDGAGHQELYLMCDDVQATAARRRRARPLRAETSDAAADGRLTTRSPLREWAATPPRGFEP